MGEEDDAQEQILRCLCGSRTQACAWPLAYVPPDSLPLALCFLSRWQPHHVAVAVAKHREELSFVDADRLLGLAMLKRHAKGPRNRDDEQASRESPRDNGGAERLRKSSTRPEPA